MLAAISSQVWAIARRRERQAVLVGDDHGLLLPSRRHCKQLVREGLRDEVRAYGRRLSMLRSENGPPPAHFEGKISAYSGVRSALIVGVFFFCPRPRATQQTTAMTSWPKLYDIALATRRDLQLEALPAYSARDHRDGAVLFRRNAGARVPSDL